MNIIKIAFAKDQNGKKTVFASCNHGEVYCEHWDSLSNEMRMILRAIANPETCKIEVQGKGFDDVFIER